MTFALRATLATVVISAAALLPACGSSSSTTASTTAGSGSATPPAGPSLLVGVVTPGPANAFQDAVLTDGTKLAAAEINAKGGVDVGGTKYVLNVKTYQDGGDPARAAAATKQAIADGAVGIVEDGIGASVSAADSNAAGVPEIVVFNGQADLPQNRPSVFRLGVPNDAASNVLSKYVAGKAKKPAIIHADTSDARDASVQLQNALGTAGKPASDSREVAASAPVFDAELRLIQSNGDDALIILGSDTFVGNVVKAARADGLTMPLFAGPSAESPAVRQIAGAAAEGLTFVTTREVSEADASSFGQFEHRLAAATGGPIDAGLKNAKGQEMRQPATYWIFSYDAVNVLAAAVSKSAKAGPSPQLITSMSQASVKSANGDNRGFNPDTHEGVSDDDSYIASVHDNQFAPVKDEPLSASLPTPDEILADFH
jgi:branched-chain amino acid transport system substrate-binding protein